MIIRRLVAVTAAVAVSIGLAAGICPAAKVVGKNGPHALDLFEKTLRVNVGGTAELSGLVKALRAGTKHSVVVSSGADEPSMSDKGSGSARSRRRGRRAWGSPAGSAARRPSSASPPRAGR